MKAFPLAFVLLILGLLGVTATATAATQGPWVLPATDLTAGDREVYFPQLAASPDGAVAAVWQIDRTGYTPFIQSVTRVPTGGFEAALDLTPTDGNAEQPQLAVSPDGTVTAVWWAMKGKAVIEARTRPPDGSFATPVDLSDPTASAQSPQIAAAGNGDVIAVWRQLDGSNWIIQAATRPAGGNFGAPVALSAPGQSAETPEVAAAPDGTVTVVWRRLEGSDWIAQAVTRPAGGSFGAPVDLSAPGHNAEKPQVVASPDGTFTVAWQRHDGVAYVIQAATRPPGGSFGAPVVLSEPGFNAYNPQLAASPNGTITTAWNRYNGSSMVIQAATRPSGGSFGTAVDLSAPGQTAMAPQLAASPDGTVTAVWYRGGNSSYTVQASTRPPGSSFGTPVDLSEPGQYSTEPLVAASADGSVTAIWRRKNGSNHIVQAAWTRQETEPNPEPGPNPNPDPDPDPKPTVPANPPNDNTAIYDSATGKLKIRLKCGGQYRPKCLTMNAHAVAGKGKRAKVMSSQVKAKNRKAGKWGYATLKVKPKFRQKVKNMGKKKTKTLWVRIKVTFKKKGKKQTRTIHHRYRVMVRE